jgi:hypothetical protein
MVHAYRNLIYIANEYKLLTGISLFSLKVRGLFLGNYNHETELASEQIFLIKFDNLPF